MIAGTVSGDGVPTIELEVGGKLWTAIIDTGFNGALELPTALKDFVNAEYAGEVSSLLAAGQRLRKILILLKFGLPVRFAGFKRHSFRATKF